LSELNEQPKQHLFASTTTWRNPSLSMEIQC